MDMNLDGVRKVHLCELMQYDLGEIKEFIKRHGPVRVARQAGLAKATLLPAARDDWNPKHSTMNAVASVMAAHAAPAEKDAAA